MAQTPMEFAAQTITETASTLLRMRTALELLSLAQSPTAPELVHWLKQLLPPDDLAFGAEFEFGVSLAAHGRWLTWQLSAEPLQLIVRLSDYLAQLGISDREMDRLSQAGERLQPPRLGSWIQITQETFDLGWYFPGDIPLHQALVWVDCQSAGERLAAWADQAGIQIAIYLGRSLGQISPFTEIRMPLPGRSVEQQLAAGLALFEALGLEGPMETALAALLHYLPAHTGLMTSIWFSPTGVSKVGVLAPDPSTLLLLQLCHLAGLEQQDTIAAFQGILGVDSPTHVECQQFADGFYLELHYQLYAAASILGDGSMTTESNNHQSKPDQPASEATPPTGPNFAMILNFFKEDDWPIIQVEDQPMLRMNFQGDNGQWSCAAQVREVEEQFVFYSICPINVPEAKRLAIAEFITRANYGLIIGNFEMDFSDGEVRYKTSIDVEGDRLSQPLIRQLVYANVLVMDRYLPGILSVIYGNASPEEAIAQIEG